MKTSYYAKFSKLPQELKDVLYVRNVEFIDENIESLEV